MTAPKTPVIGHVTPLAGAAKSLQVACARHAPRDAPAMHGLDAGEGARARAARQTVSLAAGFDLADHARTLERQVEALTAEVARLGEWRDRYHTLGEIIDENLPEVPRLPADAGPLGLVERVAYAGQVIEDLRSAQPDDLTVPGVNWQASYHGLRTAVVAVLGRDPGADLTRELAAEIAEHEARTADLVAQRDAYRDRLRTMLGVTRPDGEELIALVEARIARAAHLDALGEPLRRAALALGAEASGAPIDLAHAIEAATDELARQRIRAARIEGRLYEIALKLGATLPAPGARHCEDAVLRIERGLVDLQREHGKAERSRARWEARARRVEDKSKRGKAPDRYVKAGRKMLASARKGARR